MNPDLFDVGTLSAAAADSVRRIAIAGFHALWDGRSPAPEELGGGDGPVLDEAVAHLQARGRIELTADGHLLGVHGLTHRTTRHRIEHLSGSVNTWCALDAIGIPTALAIDARARTTCPTCDLQLVVTLVAGEPEPLAGAVLWYPETAGSWHHLVDQFCSGANLFCSLAHLRERIGSGTAAGAVMTVQEVAEIGREVWADVAQDGGRTIGGIR
ncbi:MAG TPA: organomercurial lyase [Acidimicrobiia bacterium]|nr:organomercurial lyase [Acidimicrobiia bacterium]